MKLSPRSGDVLRGALCVVILASCAVSRGQGILYLSNTSGNSQRSSLVNSTAWIAQGFETGENVQGYSLNEVDLEMSDGTGIPSGFSVGIFNDVNGLPSSSLGLLSGSPNPASSGIYSYTATGITLAPNTEYFVMTSAASAAATGSFEWGFGPALTGNSDWQSFPPIFTTSAGAQWSGFRDNAYALTSIYATAVPEPSQWALLLIGCAFVTLSARGNCGDARP